VIAMSAARTDFFEQEHLYPALESTAYMGL
jgi:hypothetical protein